VAGWRFLQPQLVIPMTAMEFLLYDVDRVLRGGGYHFFSKLTNSKNGRCLNEEEERVRDDGVLGGVRGERKSFFNYKNALGLLLGFHCSKPKL
jgi:hypothetical protein